MGDSPRPVTVSRISFTVSFRSTLRITEFRRLCEDIGRTSGVAEVRIGHTSQQVKVVIDESAINNIALIRRSVLDMLMGNNCSPIIV